MDIREHSIALVSVIVGLGVTELLGNLNRLIRARRAIRWDALPMAWAAIAFLLVNNFWWGLYLGVTGIEAPTSAGTYLLSLSMPVLLYLICAAALPYARATDGLDLRTAYFAESRYFFLLVVLYVVNSVAMTSLAAGGLEWNDSTALRCIIIAACLPLIGVRAVWYHWSATIVILVLLVHRLLEQVLH